MKTITKELSFYNGSIKVLFYPTSHRYKLVEEDGVTKNEWLSSPSSIVGKLDKSDALIPWAVGCFYVKVKELMRDGVNFSKDDVLSMLAEGKKAHTERKESAASVGDVVHLFAQTYSAEMDETYRPDKFVELSDDEQQRVNHGITAFLVWVSQTKPTFIQSEFSVYSRKNKFVGTSDVLVEVEGKKYLLDYKTSKGVYSSHFYQASAYLKAYEEEWGEKLDGAMIIHFIKEDVVDKEGEIKKKAGEFGVVTLSRGDLVRGYQGFKALQTIYSIDKEITKQLYVSK
jgi:hypothetical protein